MTEMVERAALALEQSVNVLLAQLTPTIAPGRITMEHEAARSCVRAVIAAMREPTEAMRWAHEMPDIGPDEIAEMWRAMIDTALAT